MMLKIQRLDQPNNLSYQAAMTAFEKKFFMNTLIAHRWHVTQAAETLKIDRINLSKKMQRLEIWQKKGIAILTNFFFNCIFMLDISF